MTGFSKIVLKSGKALQMKRYEKSTVWTLHHYAFDTNSPQWHIHRISQETTILLHSKPSKLIFIRVC